MSPRPEQSSRELRQSLAAEAGAEHFPSEMRYRLAAASLEGLMNHFPERSTTLCRVLDGITRLYEYQFVMLVDPEHRNPALITEVKESIDDTSAALLSLSNSACPIDQGLRKLTLSINLAAEYLDRFHGESSSPQHFSLAQHHTRRAIETALDLAVES